MEFQYYARDATQVGEVNSAGKILQHSVEPGADTRTRHKNVGQGKENKVKV